MVIPAIWLIPWPYRAAGADGRGPGGPRRSRVAAAAPLAGRRRWNLPPGRLPAAEPIAGDDVLCVGTSRSHTLPGPLPRVVAAAFAALGIDASVHGATVAVSSMRQNHLFSATWELLLDPPTWCFLIGGIVMLWWKSRGDLHRSRGKPGRGTGRP